MNQILHFITQVIQDGWHKGCVLGISRRLEQTGRPGAEHGRPCKFLLTELYLCSNNKRKPVNALGRAEMIGEMFRKLLRSSDKKQTGEYEAEVWKTQHIALAVSLAPGSSSVKGGDSGTQVTSMRSKGVRNEDS